MIEHMVWIKFKPDVSPQCIDEHLSNLRTLPRHVPGIMDLKAGANFTDRSKGFTHGLSVTFNDRAGLESYLAHPDHVKAAVPLRKDAQTMAMDVEF